MVEGVGTLCSEESGVQTPSRARSPPHRTDKVEIGNLSKATIGHNMAQHGHNSAATGKTANWRIVFFAQNSLPKFQKI